MKLLTGGGVGSAVDFRFLRNKPVFGIPDVF
jgi:hypothetical protein